jgi:hypothetical protein
MENIITSKCLIAADVDKTYVEQGSENEQEAFLLNMAPQLNKAAILGTNLALITGNSMHELMTKFLRWYCRELCATKTLDTIVKLHLFCNSGGIYIRFPEDNALIREITGGKTYDEREVFNLLTVEESGSVSIKPEFIQSDYLLKTRISGADEERIIGVLREVRAEYLGRIKASRKKLAGEYYIDEDPPDPGDGLRCDFLGGIDGISEEDVKIEIRKVRYIDSGSVRDCTSQITLKPVLSWRYAKNLKKKYSNDCRSWAVRRIQEELDERGLSQYIARPGGRSSIDITLEKLDKAYALEYLIDRLNIAGQKRFGEKFGCNAIYLGDEVISGGGNDYAVTRIPGVLVLAVNPEPKLIPFLSNVLVTSDVLNGPAAAANILSNYNEIAEVMIEQRKKNLQPKRKNKTPNAIYMLKEKWYIERIREKVNSGKFPNNLSMDEKNMIHTLVTLICREDGNAKGILASILKEFDEIIATLENDEVLKLGCCGTSHPDN